MPHTDVHGVILEKGEPFYTYLHKVFDAIGNRQLEYNWLITDCECYSCNPQTQALFNQPYCWISGEELTQIVNAEHFQWIWAVLSGFDKRIPLEEVLRYPLPEADCYEGFWINPVTMQHPLAQIEIVPWDSSLTLLISRNRAVVDDFTKAYPLCEPLDVYNARSAANNISNEAP